MPRRRRKETNSVHRDRRIYVVQAGGSRRGLHIGALRFLTNLELWGDLNSKIGSNLCSYCLIFVRISDSRMTASILLKQLIRPSELSCETLFEGLIFFHGDMD